MLTRLRLRGHAPAAMLSLCLCAASACGDDTSPGSDAGADPDATPAPDAPRNWDANLGEGTALTPFAYTAALTYGNPPFIIPRPTAINGHLYLVVLGNQVSGTISAHDPDFTDTVSLAEVSGRMDGSMIVLEDVTVAVTPGGTLVLDELRLTLIDAADDGQIDGATGQATGSWQRVLGDVIDQTPHTSVVNAILDTEGTSATLFVPRGTPDLLPFDGVDVRFQEPLRETDVRENLRILVDGAAATGELTVTATNGLVTAAAFQPDAFLGFGAEVTVDLATLQDPSGNALTASDASLTVVADPGPLADNTGFEAGLTGWIALGQADTEGTFQGFEPPAGAAQAVVNEGGTLAAALDVPADATELDLSVAVLSEIGEVTADRTTVIALRTASGELFEIFDVADVAADFAECETCETPYGQSVGPLRRTFDLTPLRGQRVFLTVDVRSSSFIGVNFYAALIDDIVVGQVR